MASSSLKSDFANVPMMRRPETGSHTETEEFGIYIGKKYNTKIENYWDLHRWSVENTSQFWAEMWNYAKIIYSKPYVEVIDKTAKLRDSPEWFKGAQLNVAENLLRYRDDRQAIIVAGEDRKTDRITYFQMYRESCKYGAALKKLGLYKGDRVAGFISNREEAIYAMLGTLAAGALWMGALPFFGAQAVINRFQQTSPKFLFTIDRLIYNGTVKDMLPIIAEISKALSSLEKVIIVPTNPSSVKRDISGIKNGCFLSEFLSYALDADGAVPELTFEQVPFNYPVFISYTSGTTGMPKAIMHGSGVLLNTVRNFGLQSNISRHDVLLSASPVGWASWNMFATTFILGSCLVVYEGVPYFSHSPSFWDLIDEFQISYILLTPNILEELERKKMLSKKNSLSSLKMIVGSSSVIKPQSFTFVYQKIKSDILFGSFYACTECLGYCMLAERSLPVYKGEISVPALGASIRCFNENGTPVEGEVGELVFTKPSPSLPIGLWNDEKKLKFQKAYFSQYSDALRIGDMCLINPVTKGTVLYGRSDDTLKPKGVRFGSSEIYNIVAEIPEIQDSLCVSQYNKQRDERVVLFLKLNRGYSLTTELISRIGMTIEKELARGYVPEVILETKEIPYNMNGKKMEIIVKNIINGMPYNSETVMNADCLANFMNIPQLKEF